MFFIPNDPMMVHIFESVLVFFPRQVFWFVKVTKYDEFDVFDFHRVISLQFLHDIKVLW